MCQGGTRVRSRECSNPFPGAGELQCERMDGSRGMEEAQYMPCSDQPCDRKWNTFRI